MNTLLKPWKTVILKVGSSLVAPDGNGCSNRYLLPIAQFVSNARSSGKQVIIVSSGSVAAGIGALPILAAKANRSIAEKQALAAVGQSKLIAHWQRYFDHPCAQVLLTRDDIHSRSRFLNISNTLGALLKNNVIPVINENDTVAVEELRVGDNDNLAAHVAALANADLLVLCSDVDGLFNGDPQADDGAKLIPVVETIDETIYGYAQGQGSSIATGGMRTKLEAAENATRKGVDCVILNGKRPQPLNALLQHTVDGTFFPASRLPMAARKHWILHSPFGTGSLMIDAGAAAALVESGASLLAKGILACEGEFARGDRVDVAQSSAPEKVIAQGLVQYGQAELRKILGLHSDEIAPTLGYTYSDEVIHRNDLVLL